MLFTAEINEQGFISLWLVRADNREEALDIIQAIFGAGVSVSILPIKIGEHDAVYLSEVN